ncbi:uncharacterized protein LOC142616352 [Castanea sativa]|uniref:uncharacterized protein LOC142616352 n=1 Tax=Castanea sativa TaxID=21020 RepID=UPI003F650B79
MDKCFDLKQQIENLIRQGKLRNFLGRDHKDEKMKAKVEELSRPPLGQIRVIIRGTSIGQSSKSRKTYLKMVQNVQLSEQSPRTRGADEQAIMFTDEDAERVHHPHNDVIVITLLIANYTTRRVLVDNGSSTDILYYPAFQQMRPGRDQLRPVNSPLVGFGGIKVQSVGTITLPVVVEAYPQQITKEFLIEYGVGQVQGDQLAAKECYLAMLAMGEHVQMMNIELLKNYCRAHRSTRRHSSG